MRQQNRALAISLYRYGRAFTTIEWKDGETPHVYDIFPFWEESEIEKMQEAEMYAQVEKLKKQFSAKRKRKE